MKDELVLRRCDPDNDMDTIVDLERAIFRPSEQYTLGFINWLCRNCTKYSYIAFMGDKPVGYIISCIEGFSRGHVISVGVLGEYRRRGIGSELMSRSICSMVNDGADYVILEVRVSNTPAITLYRKLGFEVRDLLRAYYSDGEDGYLMILNNERFREFVNRHCTSITKQPT
ncbi:MAG: ribosomal protein S18-alanine N-acetyltransferase [Vulcanisaeta sp.]|jgi:ribosomal-protein-alanine acetyltransferase|nr:MAG: ribosomal-protein-alanine acetyltransferase [Vulcanisaeta sp. CIS_19]MCG2865576.1 ribosomal protein S18-alanine N-acetyltransferase [Vulcanisaeta sp.]MCG2885955.1 ribosomal protein S18-alanine N-acetyltransferase [Vulcanisaeta sp.]MDT7863708.1 ribosomal protein S18-alanine N-acetyltransferase [Vulcanisaeta sp.]